MASINENERAVAELITVEKWDRIAEVATSDQKQKQFVEVSKSWTLKLYLDNQLVYICSD